ncbi:MAG: response regulator transcription factor [Eubacteriales bacterium]|nr:response regulator transcription factor [Eubacteriales bacterium]
MKLLLLEDEEILSNAISKGLHKLGFAVDQAFDGETGLELYEVNEYDLIILDLNLPVLDGMEVLAHIRRKDARTKVLILSARSEVSDRVCGLDAGANDYLVKPFDFDELIARIHNLLRQSFVQTPSRLSDGTVTIDILSKSVEVDGVPVTLTNKEYAILEYLMMNMGRVVSQSELIEHVWNSETDPFSNSLKFHMYSLKKKLGSEGLISTIRGQGYIVKGGETKHER